MQRSTNWKHEDGTPATVAALSDCLAPFIKELATQGIDIYDSCDFKVGVDLKKLKASLGLLHALVRLDGRGGFFAQKDLTEALQAAAQAADEEASTSARALQHHKELNEFYLMVAYRIRVMLAHVRQAFDSHEPGTTHVLSSVFQEMYSCDDGSNPKADARKHRRNQRLLRRPHPFQCFRPAEAQDDADGDAEEAPFIVTKFFDGGCGAARLLMSNGDLVNADVYVEGDNGFIAAQWTSAELSLELEVPNSHLDKETKKIKEWVPKKVTKRPAGRKPVLKKPACQPSCEGEAGGASVVAKAGADDEAEAGGAAEADEEMPDQAEPADGWTMKLRGAHNDSMTLVVYSHSKDKAQVLQVSKEMCAQVDLGPKEVCEKILEQMQDQVSNIKGKVANNTELVELREAAKVLRTALLQPK